MGSIKGPIIVIEDDIDEKEILVEILQNLGITNELKFFTAGDTVLEYLRTTTDRPFVIISDINLPRMTGLELKEIIRNDDDLRRKSIPFVFLSTTASKPAVEKSYDLESQGFFVKQHAIRDMERQLKIIFDYWMECRHTNSDNY